MKMSPALKVGILSILSLIVLILGIMWLKGRSISIGEKIDVHFRDIDGMRPGSGVQMMGMRVGQVDEIIPVINGENSYVIVRFVINEPGITIPTASKISIQQSGIIGEKFIEITPPFVETVYVPLSDGFNGEKPQVVGLELLAGGNYIVAGDIKSAKIIDTHSLPAEIRKKFNTTRVYKIDYFVNVPDLEIPANSEASLSKKEKNKYILRFTPPEGVIVDVPDSNKKFTVIEPLRLKEFFDIQMKVAVSLKETNDKINALFTDEFVGDVKYTFENTRELSEKASLIMDQVAEIINSSKGDLQELIATSTELSKNMSELSKNVNEIVDDPAFKSNLIATATSIRTASDDLSKMLRDSKLQESLININSSSKDVAEITKYVNELTKDQEFNNTLSETIDNLNLMMVKLTKTADSMNELTVEEKETIKKIIQNSADASEDMKKFSEKLNKRFLLLRLLI
ncbi:MAG: MCE family protein [Candidatus Gastranaerophilales bacterium]|nr:MCE family protein [Candidatus Gastranaerophilales bacterium]